MSSRYNLENWLKKDLIAEIERVKINSDTDRQKLAVSNHEREVLAKKMSKLEKWAMEINQQQSRLRATIEAYAAIKYPGAKIASPPDIYDPSPAAPETDEVRFFRHLSKISNDIDNYVSINVESLDVPF